MTLYNAALSIAATLYSTVALVAHRKRSHPFPWIGRQMGWPKPWNETRNCTAPHPPCTWDGGKRIIRACMDRNLENAPGGKWEARQLYSKAWWRAPCCDRGPCTVSSSRVCFHFMFLFFSIWYFCLHVLLLFPSYVFVFVHFASFVSILCFYFSIRVWFILSFFSRIFVIFCVVVFKISAVILDRMALSRLHLDLVEGQ